MTVSVTTVAGWTVYLVVFNEDGEVWNGSSFVADSPANRNAGAIAATESPSGTYTATFPVLITEAGDYPFTFYRQLGGSPSTAGDTVLTPPSTVNTVTIADPPPEPTVIVSPYGQADALAQTMEIAAETDAIVDFTMDPAPLTGGVYGIAGWSIEVRIARNIGDDAILTLPASIIVVGSATVASVFRVSFSTDDITGYSGVYRFQAFRTDTGSRDLLAGARLVAAPIILE